MLRYSNLHRIINQMIAKIFVKLATTTTSKYKISTLKIQDLFKEGPVNI